MCGCVSVCVCVCVVRKFSDKFESAYSKLYRKLPLVTNDMTLSSLCLRVCVCLCVWCGSHVRCYVCVCMFAEEVQRKVTLTV